METTQQGKGCSKQTMFGIFGCSFLAIALIPLFCFFSIVIIGVTAGTKLEEGYITKNLESGDSQNAIAVIDLDGVIMDTQDGTHTVSITDYMLDSLDAANDNPKIKAVIIKFNTPGGSVYDSARIEEKINVLQKNGKLVVGVIESMSASGGYWIASSVDYLYIQPESLTGSIGVLFENVDYDELLNKVGVKEIVLTNKEAINKVPKNLDDPNNPQRKPFDDILAADYDAFVNLIAQGRKLSREQVLPYADGRIIEGRKAVELKFADELGGYDQAVEYIKKKLNVEKPEIIEYSWPKLVGFGGISAKVNNIFQMSDKYGKSGGQVMAMPSYYFDQN